jgi:tellurite resistance protein
MTNRPTLRCRIAVRNQRRLIRGPVDAPVLTEAAHVLSPLKECSMPYPNRLPGPSRSERNDPDVVHHFGIKTISAIVTAASLVACADGQATSDERRALLRFLRERGILARSGRRGTVGVFDRAVEAAAESELDDLTEALSTLSALADKPSAMLALEAAQQVAMADGVLWPQEAAMIAVLSDRLRLRGNGRLMPDM